MTEYVYRGTSLSGANESEFGSGRIEGFTFDIYKGKLDTETPQATVPRGTDIRDLPWWKPDGEDRPYLVEQQGVTGGLTDVIGTAIGFSRGVPLVLYFTKSGLNGRGAAIRYHYDWFDSYPGGLAWVKGTGEGSVTGEIHAMEEGLIGLVKETENGVVVHDWGEQDLSSISVRYEDEREVLVMDDHIDVASSLHATAVSLEGRRTVKQALATFDGYHAGFGDENEQDTSRWSQDRALSTLHEEVRARAAMGLDNLWILSMSTSIQESVRAIPEDVFEFAYDGETVYESPAEVPGWLLGRD